MRLQQGQIWQQGTVYFRIIRLERLVVEYKELMNLAHKTATVHKVTKKEFCRMLKGATALKIESPAPIRPASAPAPKQEAERA